MAGPLHPAFPKTWIICFAWLSAILGRMHLVEYVLKTEGLGLWREENSIMDAMCPPMEKQKLPLSDLDWPMG